MEKISTKIRMSNELHHQIPADIREQGVKSQIIQGIAKKIVDDNLISIKETKECGHTNYETSFLIMQEDDYRNLVNEINKLKQTIDMANSVYAFTLERHIKQIGRFLKIK